MRLKKIRLAGFKSFVDPTNIPFPGKMTAIVGPNGCGKSNVIDAVRWVLGESSAKNLRGDAMTDVIFNGSSARKPVSQSSVELVFDNTRGRVAGEFANYSELSVKRVVTKDAISSYLLNGSKCRRKDITDLFLGTGLGPRSYAIIEQGMISRLIESKPQELRVFIEEAAGISKYKERRKETQNRIQHTKENLDRLQDVRSELSEQLNKLKRQAAAANKYKELKLEERQIKSYLAAIRWQQQDEIVQEAGQAIQEQQHHLEDLLASRQSEASTIQNLKNEQSIKKQKLNDLQTSIYNLGNEITKLEQSQIFSKKRLAQIQNEKEQLHQAATSIEQELSTIHSEVIEFTNQIEELEPEKFSLEQQLDVIQENRALTKGKLNDLENLHKREDDNYYQTKQHLQKAHSELQQTLILQQRTQSRIQQIQAEIDEIKLHEKGDEAEISVEIQSLEAQLREQTDNHQQRSLNFVDAKEKLERQRSLVNELENKVFRVQAKREALAIMQSESTDSVVIPDWMDKARITPVWQAFSISSEHKHSLETVLQLFDNVHVYSGNKPHQFSDIQSLQGRFWFASEFTDLKLSGTLAELIEQQYIPWVFNHIYILEGDEEWQPKLAADDQQSYITKDGIWIAQAMLFTRKVNQQSKLELAAESRDLDAQLIDINDQLNEGRRALDEQSPQLQALESKANSTRELVEDIKRTLNHKKNDLHLTKIQNQQLNERSNKLLLDMQTQQEVLVEEQESLEQINVKIETLSIDSADLEDARRQRELEKESVKKDIENINAQLESTQSQLHRQQLNLQQLKNGVQLATEQQRIKTQLQMNQHEKLMLLEEEAEQLLLPTHEQQQRLQQQIQRQSVLNQDKNDLNHELDDLQQNIEQLEKGQSGLDATIDKIKSIIESKNIQAESARVRAQSYIEQLSESKLSIDDVLHKLPANAEETTFQQSLEKLSGSLRRLGAVNLAAVDEFNEQAERKTHLDTQNDDLVAALETLEAAMRKIDKETKSRFKATFDDINNDLKSLFPKVFGGGSAYLDLTEDDLLETGVSIMARPPGKKNSTIHLLSGGEKALTALSLVFAIFRLNPAPFCLLDEVDAPLDDANVGRFCKLVSEMSNSVQFIYITHNKVAMEMASHLTGVTMAEPGVSRMVSVSMEEALEIAE